MTSVDSSEGGGDRTFMSRDKKSLRGRPLDGLGRVERILYAICA